MKDRILLFILVLLVFAGCRRQPPLPEQGMWGGTVELQENMVLPFRMSLDFSGAKPAGYFLVGDEKNPIPEISREADSLTFGFSEYGAEMRGTWTGNQWSGEYLRHRSTGTKSFMFTAVPEDSATMLMSPQAPAPAFPAGNYQVYFEGEDEAAATTVAKLWKDGDELYGTFIAPDGDYGVLAGQPAGAGFQLNRFTGWQATVITLDQDAGTWAGKFYAASNDKPRAFTLKPRSDLNVETPPSLQTRMKDPNSQFTFSCMSLSGDTVRSSDERFKGKALMVDIMGTWCHNCLDAAPLLQQLQDRYGKDGFEVVGLSFEISDDPAVGRKNLQLYRDRFGLTYPLLFCGSLDDPNVEKQLHSQLENFFAYPTTIFIDRRNRVRHIHSGFKGPGTGDEYQRQVQQFDGYARETLN
jgi:thiol-disulfide isomerase/thioredoxin